MGRKMFANNGEIGEIIRESCLILKSEIISYTIPNNGIEINGNNTAG